MKKVYRKSNLKTKGKSSPFRDYWTSTNYIILIVGFVLLLVGFYLMTFAPWANPVSLTVSPIVLLVAFLVVFPFAIFYRKKNTQKEE